MKRLVIAIVCTVMLTGWRWSDVIPAPALDAYQGQPLTLVVHKKATFIASTSGRAAFALFGALASFSAGNKIVKDNDIADPAAAIADRLGEELAQRLKSSAPATVNEFDEDTNKEIAKAASGKGLALYVEAMGWGFEYYPLKWGRYNVHYAARARLVDAATGQTLAQGPCGYVSNDEDHAPDYDTMMADNAAFIKTATASAADACVATFDEKMLGIAPTPAPAKN